MTTTRSTFLRGLAAAPLVSGLTALALTLGATGARADDERWTYEVTVTNLTYQQQFTPLLLATHRDDLAFFSAGQPASAALRTLAEEGNVAPLRAALEASGRTTAIEAGNGLLAPGGSITFTLRGHPRRDRLSIAAMLIPTNDAFMALNAMPLPQGRDAVTYTVPAYDAGTEVNDELCGSIPGPMFAECGGPGGGAQVGGGEGFVHIHRGMQGVGQMNAAARDWRNPVAAIEVRRVR